MLVRRTYLDLDNPGALRAPARPPTVAVRFAPHRCTVAEYRALYRAVGARWRWTDRDAWPDERLAAHLADPDVRVWIATVADAPDEATAGYFELQRHAGGDVEVVYFGLVERWVGHGLGGAMLVRAVDEAWRLGAARVWLHTCTLDAPQALANYLARGFRVTREETYEVAD